MTNHSTTPLKIKHSLSKLQTPTISTNLSVALLYASYGWRVHPLHHIRADGTCSCNKPHHLPKHKPAKHPRTTGNWQKIATTDVKQIRKWWTDEPGDNIGIVCDANLLVIDVDDKNGGSLQPSIDAYPELQQVFDNSYTIKTGDRSGNSRHYYFRGDKDIPRKLFKHGLGKGIEIITGRNYVVAPPSNHVHGNTYEYISGELNALPAILKAVILDGQQKSNKTGDINKGERNNTLASIAGTMFRNGGGLTSVTKHLYDENLSRCKPPLEFDEVQAIAASINTLSANDKKSFKTIWQETVSRAGLPLPMRAILIELSFYASVDGTNCYPEQQTIADNVQFHRKTVGKYLDMAEEYGFIKRYKHGREGHGWKYAYRLILPDSKNL